MSTQAGSYVYSIDESRSLYYANMPMQYTAIFHGCKNDDFQVKNYDNFLIFAQNVDRAYT